MKEDSKYNKLMTGDNLFTNTELSRTILERSKILIYSHTPDHIINFVSPYAKKLLGFDPVVLKTAWNDIITSNLINKKGIKLKEAAINTGRPQGPFELELKNKRNKTAWFEVRELPIVKNGQTILIVGTLTDITLRKNVEDELTKSTSLLASALEMANMGPWEYDVASDRFKFNDQFYKMLHTNVREIGSYYMSSTEYAERFLIAEEARLVGMEIRNAVNSPDPGYYRELEHSIVYADGSKGTLAVRFNIVKDERGRTIRTYGVNQDITRRKSEEKELLEAKLKAEEMNRLKSSFLANMSHELRTPMVGILGFADILLEELKNSQNIEMVVNIRNNGLRLISTLNSILDLSRIEANRQDIRYSLVNLNELVREIIKFYEPSIKSKNLYLEFISAPGNYYLTSDKDLLFKIVSNLVDNAVKYTHRGSIEININLQGAGADRRIFVEVSDTGIGIPEKHRDMIFEPFRQVSEGYSRKFQGTGLGLSITKKFVELLNGSITFKSKPGEGSTFAVSFPYTTAPDINFASAKKTDNTVDEFNGLEDFIVLLVEDDPNNALVITTYLKNYIRVDHSINGQKAILACRSKKYNAVLMDINLKGIDGIESLKQIRAINDYYAGIPVVAVTAYAMASDKEKFLSLGFTHYLSKPFNRSQLITLLKSILIKEDI